MTEDDVDASIKSPPAKRRRGKKDEVEVDEKTVEEKVKVEQDGVGEVKVTKKRTTKKKETITMVVPRTQGSSVSIGAHVSTAGGIHNAITNLLMIGANAFALFMKNQRKWENPPLDPEFAKLFIAGCKEHDIDPAKCCLPHGSYLVNLAHPDTDRKKQAYDSFLDDLIRCDRLGILLYNFHPGNANATTREEGIRLIAEAINRAHKDPATGKTVPVLETMATLGNTIGGTFKDLKEIIDLVDDQTRVGVCLDTCHVFAAGYDLRTPEAYAETMKKFDEVIGLKFLKALHINDSKAPFSSNRDLHARIGTGYLGLRAFHNIVNDTRLHRLPMVLETPVDVIGEDGKKFEDKSIWAREIKMLESLVGMDVESDEFRELEAKLQKEGDAERKKTGDAFDKKLAKAAKPAKATKAKVKGAEPKPLKAKAAPRKKKAAKKVEAEDEDEDEEDE
ncbi:AP endonuclease [Setomelanomma holmii]|uniref:Apurinic-apyrimidinic endonuclease 1 n=1 Tax=Setomelanomma holmii TaxID=210430 RepID=A0A9P4H1Q0_9PLEO|nr:AP endonuclease [Setomelanomma holmii]